MTPQQALITLYNATKMLQLKAEDHETLKQCALVIEKAIAPKEEVTGDAEHTPPTGTGKKGSK